MYLPPSFRDNTTLQIRKTGKTHYSPKVKSFQSTESLPKWLLQVCMNFGKRMSDTVLSFEQFKYLRNKTVSREVKSSLQFCLIVQGQSSFRKVVEIVNFVYYGKT